MVWSAWSRCIKGISESAFASLTTEKKWLAHQVPSTKPSIFHAEGNFLNTLSHICSGPSRTNALCRSRWILDHPYSPCSTTIIPTIQLLMEVVNQSAPSPLHSSRTHICSSHSYPHCIVLQYIEDSLIALAFSSVLFMTPSWIRCVYQLYQLHYHCVIFYIWVWFLLPFLLHLLFTHGFNKESQSAYLQ